jgi:hypothetical protein
MEDMGGNRIHPMAGMGQTHLIYAGKEGIMEVHGDFGQHKVTKGPRQSQVAEQTYSQNEVSEILCEACKLGVRSVSTDGVWAHRINGQDIPCLADEWRRKSSQILLNKERRDD